MARRSAADSLKLTFEHLAALRSLGMEQTFVALANVPMRSLMTVNLRLAGQSFISLRLRQWPLALQC